MGMDGAGAGANSRENPSFSSTLLDEIYRSTDLHQQSSTHSNFRPTKLLYPNPHVASFQHDQNPNAHDDQRPPTCSNLMRQKPSSGSMRYERQLFSLDSSCSVLKPPKPIRTTRLYQHGEGEGEGEEDEYHHSQTKSKALNFYRDLKKHPISPGGRFATFLKSLFSTRNTKKPTNTGGAYTRSRKSKSANSSILSPSSLTNNPSPSPSPRAKPNNQIKRSSVRFYPVVGDQPCGHKSLHQQQTTAQNSINKDVVKLNLSDKNHHISEAARNLLKSYQNKVERLSRNRNSEYEYESDDAGSDTSSDLFELHNLSPIAIATATATGIHKYPQDLPLYETTQLHTIIKSCHC